MGFYFGKTSVKVNKVFFVETLQDCKIGLQSTQERKNKTKQNNDDNKNKPNRIRRAITFHLLRKKSLNNLTKGIKIWGLSKWEIFPLHTQYDKKPSWWYS